MPRAELDQSCTWPSGAVRGMHAMCSANIPCSVGCWHAQFGIEPVPTKRYPSLFETSVMRRDRRKVKRSGRVIGPAQSGN